MGGYQASSDKQQTSNGGSAASGSTCPEMIIDGDSMTTGMQTKPEWYEIGSYEGLVLRLQRKAQIPMPSSTFKRVAVMTSPP